MHISFRRRLEPGTPRPPLHEDPGLQPERTSLAWGRTLLTMITVSALFLRWMPYHGTFVGMLVALSLATALGIWTTQQRRYARSASGVKSGRIQADAISIFWLGASVFVLGALGLYTVIFLPISS
ncbi:DUF202 domain-containing protein [Stutzerimonas stutzeri]|uniref:DUF202 domain-containing protein n=1 Tax=Stutzerimonas stutzeri TaxID=316 RepID=A0A2N8SZL1_STUST|nr:DUF202 domain-containing protein [Stutzerimonas stutzeri]MCQ4248636.1 DUF202 domain-containing protein [Stutzerimonas stutzeri]PNG07931.1 hypothetical protein CXL00_02455 [Stutzerimonas stutzeri]PNG14969.1 hypothetical protein CXK97_01900 [Stutzerimonas stutzeri]